MLDDSYFREGRCALEDARCFVKDAKSKATAKTINVAPAPYRRHGLDTCRGYRSRYNTYSLTSARATPQALLGGHLHDSSMHSALVMGHSSPVPCSRSAGSGQNRFTALARCRHEERVSTHPTFRCGAASPFQGLADAASKYWEA